MDKLFNSVAKSAFFLLILEISICNFFYLREMMTSASCKNNLSIKKLFASTENGDYVNECR